jgi:hypothetical protein
VGHHEERPHTALEFAEESQRFLSRETMERGTEFSNIYGKEGTYGTKTILHMQLVRYNPFVNRIVVAACISCLKGEVRG